VVSEGGNVEPRGLQRIPDRWRGEAVEVIHHIQQAGVLLVGPTAGVLEESDDLGVLLSVTEPQRGSVEHRFFPWATVVQIIAPLG
jgi:hypothetical protein